MLKNLVISIFLILISGFEYNKDNINTVSLYLNNLNSLMANFIQINELGEHSDGQIKIQKPGKIRIEFNNSNKLLVGDGKKIALINKKFSQITYYNYEQLPLQILLTKEFKLNSFFIKDFSEYENIIEIELSESSGQNHGSIRLIFENKPLKLKKWIINEFNGGKIEVFLSDLEVNKNIDKKFFRINNPKKIILGE